MSLGVLETAFHQAPLADFVVGIVQPLARDLAVFWDCTGATIYEYLRRGVPRGIATWAVLETLKKARAGKRNKQLV